MRRQPEEPQAHRARPLDRRVEELPPEALPAPLAEDCEALHFGSMRPVLGLGSHDLHRADDATVFARREQHAPRGIELRGRLDPDLARMLGREPECHVRFVRVEQKLRQVAGGRRYFEGRELDDLHAASIPTSASTRSSPTRDLRT
jgi:hypothetical protein